MRNHDFLGRFSDNVTTICQTIFLSGCTQQRRYDYNNRDGRKGLSADGAEWVVYVEKRGGIGETDGWENVPGRAC